MEAEKILVPLIVEALCVDANTAEAEVWKNLSVNYGGLSQKIGFKLEEEHLKGLMNGLCEPGIHLHWALPTALTRGISHAGGITFPNVPDRWIVIRNWMQNNKPRSRTWILESNRIPGDANSATSWAVKEGDSYRSALIGKSFLYENYQPGKVYPPITAIGPGNPAFAAVYASSRNVFGFYDDLSDLAEETAETVVLSYFTAGWYADPLSDPLSTEGAGSDPDSIAEKIRQAVLNSWQIHGLDDRTAYPERILCYGSLHSVRFDLSGAEMYTLPYNHHSVEVALGEHAVEAKSIQLSKWAHMDETLMNAYLLDALKDITLEKEMEEAIFNGTFAAYDGGISWELVPAEDQTEQKQPKMQVHELFRKDASLSEAYHSLVRFQDLYEHHVRCLETLIVELRALFDKFILADALNRTIVERSRKAIQEEISKTAAGYHEAKTQIAVHKSLLLSNQLIKEPGQADRAAQAAFLLSKRQKGRFYEPLDPSVLISGPALYEANKFSSGRNSTLRCRLQEEITEAITLNDMPRSSIERTIRISTLLPDAIREPKGSLTAAKAALINQLQREQLLFDPAFAELWAMFYYNAEPGSSLLADDLSADLHKLLEGSSTRAPFVKSLTASGGELLFPFGSKETFNHFLNERSIRKWQHPFSPVYMIWYADFIPSYSQTKESKSFDHSQWRFDGHQYRFTGNREQQSAPLRFSGKTLVSNAIADLLNQKFPPSDEFKLNLAQVISGFNDQLLMRQQSIQLPPFKPGMKAAVLDTSIEDFLNSQFPQGLPPLSLNYFLPVAENENGERHFFPLRAGLLRLSYVSLVDSFGQVLEVLDTDRTEKQHQVAVPARIKDPGVVSQILLSPKLLQRARLHFSFRSAADDRESNSDPATSPLCGWLMPDRLNAMLYLYDAGGKSCGAFELVSDPENSFGKKVLWRHAQLPFNETFSNPFLKAFAAHFYAAEQEGMESKARNLEDFIDLARRKSLNSYNNWNNSSPAIAQLIGQPLALVRAKAGIDCYGTAPQPQGWKDEIETKSFKTAEGTKDSSFPVSLGDFNGINDGLIGYFNEQNGFSKFYLPENSAMENLSADYFVQEHLTLPAADTTGGTGLFLVMNPGAEVQIHCGILPSKRISLPASYQTGMQHIHTEFLVAPVLGHPDAPYIPLGNEPDKEWKLLLNSDEDKSQKLIEPRQKADQFNAIKGQMAIEGLLQLVTENKNRS